jgi:hypothetical protein
MYKLKLIILAAFAVFFAVAAPAATVFAQTSKEAVCEGVGFATGDKTCNDAKEAGKVPAIVKMAIGMFQLVVGIISVFVMGQAGLAYITSGGDSGKTKTARERILYAAIGIAVVILAQIIVSFVLNRVSTVA